MSVKYQPLPSLSSVSKKKNGTSVVMQFLRFIKYLLFFVVILLWIVAFIGVGVVLLQQKTTLVRKIATSFIIIGVAPLVIFLIYLIMSRRRRHSV